MSGSASFIKHNLWGAINFGLRTKYVKYQWFWHSDPGPVHLGLNQNFHNGIPKHDLQLKWSCGPSLTWWLFDLGNDLGRGGDGSWHGQTHVFTVVDELFDLLPLLLHGTVLGHSLDRGAQLRDRRHRGRWHSLHRQVGHRNVTALWWDRRRGRDGDRFSLLFDLPLC